MYKQLGVIICTNIILTYNLCCSHLDPNIGSTYEFVFTGADITTADSYCLSQGSHLVYIESSEEADYLEMKIQEYDDLRNRSYWIGLTRGINSTKMWMDGSEVIFNKLNVIENGGGECFYLSKYTGQIEYSWSDYPCERMLPYICEAETLMGK